MSNHPLTERLLNLVQEHQDVVGYPDWDSLAPAFDEMVITGLADEWDEGHDTALINGQSQNPYDKEQK